MTEIAHAYQLKRPNLPSFEGTGYDIQSEKKGLSKTYNQEIDAGKTRPEAAQVAISEVVGNIRTYTSEYIERGLIYPHLIQRSEYKGRKRMVNSYNGLPVVDRITRAERFGAVAAASEEVEAEMMEAEPGTVGLYTSPPGWTGMYAEIKGRKVPIVYKDSQTLAWWIDDVGQMHGLTITSDMTVDQNIEFLSKFNVPKEKHDLITNAKTEKETIANIVRNVVILSPNKGHSMTIEEIALKILEVRGFGDIISTGANGEQVIRSAQDLLRDVRRRDELLRFDTNAETQIEAFMQFGLDNAKTLGDDFTQNRVMDEVKRTVLRIVGQELSKKRGFKPKEGNFDTEIAYLLSWGGCNGGGYGSEGMMINGSFGGRFGYYDYGQTQRTEFINGEYFLILDSGERIKGKKCSNILCGVTVCGDRCFRCKKFLT